jgi:septum formation protein
MSEAAAPRLILASGSQTRAGMLRAAGLNFEVVPAIVDEPALFEDARAKSPNVSPGAIAELLARAKAVEVSRRHPDALIIGGDQVLALGREMIFKAKDRAEAKSILLKLKGRSHDLHSAAALATGGVVDWTGIDTARLTTRDFSAAFLDDYLDRAGGALTSSAGAYQIEGYGVNLFEHVAGNHATILGLPLLGLLAELRARRVVLS